jgi:hypothetical protein
MVSVPVKEVSVSRWFRGFILVVGAVLCIVVADSAFYAAKLDLDIDRLPGRIMNTGRVPHWGITQVMALSFLVGLVGFGWAASDRARRPVVAGILGVIEGGAYMLLVRAADSIGQGLSMRSFGIVGVSERLVVFGGRLLALGLLMLGVSLLFGGEGMRRPRRVLLLTGIVAAIMALSYSRTERIGLICLAVAVASEAGALWCFWIDRAKKTTEIT